jgi:hypothetical protein
MRKGSIDIVLAWLRLLIVLRRLWRYFHEKNHGIFSFAIVHTLKIHPFATGLRKDETFFMQFLTAASHNDGPFLLASTFFQC